MSSTLEQRPPDRASESPKRNSHSVAGHVVAWLQWLGPSVWLFVQMVSAPASSAPPTWRQWLRSILLDLVVAIPLATFFGFTCRYLMGANHGWLTWGAIAGCAVAVLLVQVWESRNTPHDATRRRSMGESRQRAH